MRLADALPSAGVLSQRVLNRTLLSRQLLLERADMTAVDAISHLVGMQAQAPKPPYLGLWTRLRGFKLDDLSTAVLERRVVRIALQRNTIHLVTSQDCLALRPVLQPLLDQSLRTILGARLAGVDLERLAHVGREILEEEPLTFSALGKRLAEHWPDTEPTALAQGVRHVLPLVQIPPRGIWGGVGQAIHTTAESWLGRPLEADAAPDAMVLRYLAAFGPASVRDVQTWCGLTRLNEVVRRQRDRLVRYQDENGVELLDLAGLPLADPDTPAPVRFVPDFDNIVLSHEDRTRVIADAFRPLIFTVNGLIKATVLIDGFVAGQWRIEEKRGRAVLLVEPFTRWTKVRRGQVEREGNRLLEFAAAKAKEREVLISAA
jgi:DNA glycosylase AlkZ-like